MREKFTTSLVCSVGADLHSTDDRELILSVVANFTQSVRLVLTKAYLYNMHAAYSTYTRISSAHVREPSRFPPTNGWKSDCMKVERTQCLPDLTMDAVDKMFCCWLKIPTVRVKEACMEQRPAMQLQSDGWKRGSVWLNPRLITIKVLMHLSGGPFTSSVLGSGRPTL